MYFQCEKTFFFVALASRFLTAHRPPITHGWTLPNSPTRLDYMLEIGWPTAYGRVDRWSIWQTLVATLFMRSPTSNDGKFWASTNPLIDILDAAAEHTLVKIVVADPTRRYLEERASRENLVAATNVERRHETHFRDRAPGTKFVPFALETHDALSRRYTSPLLPPDFRFFDFRYFTRAQLKKHICPAQNQLDQAA